MFKERGIILIIILFCLVPIFSFAQEQMSQRESSELSDELAIQVVEKEKEKALKAGEKAKAEVIDTKIRDFKAGKITKSEFLTPGGTQSGTPYGGSAYRGDSYSGGSTQEEFSQGMAGLSQKSSTSSRNLNELYKAKEMAIKSGDMEEAKRIHVEIERIRKIRRISQDKGYQSSDIQGTPKEMSGSSQQGPPDGKSFGPSSEMIIKSLEKEKESALKSGNVWAADAIESKIKDLKSGKITMEELMNEKR